MMCAADMHAVSHTFFAACLNRICLFIYLHTIRIEAKLSERKKGTAKRRNIGTIKVENGSVKQKIDQACVCIQLKGTELIARP